MNENTFYYTLSTIAQTLAGAFGFLVAVAMYRLQASGPLEQTRLREYHEAQTIHQNARRNEGPASVNAAAERLEKAKRAWENERDKPAVIKADLMKSLKLTAVTIVVCFAALPFVPALMSSRWTYYPACVGLLVVVGMGVSCVWRRYRPLVKTLVD